MRFRPAAAAALALTTVVGLAAYLWPFFAAPGFSTSYGQDAPWLFAALLGLMAFVVLAEVTEDGQLDIDGELFDDLTRAAVAVDAEAEEGEEFWCLADDDQRTALASLVADYASAGHK